MTESQGTQATPSRDRELVERLADGSIGLEQFLWAARDSGIDRRRAARYAVDAAATGTPGGRSVGTPGVRSVGGGGPVVGVGTGVGGGTGASGGAAVARGEPRATDGTRAAVLRIGIWLPPDGLDPAIATYRTSRLVTEQLYSTLMALDAVGRPYPDLAEWIDVSDDGLTYTFGLVPGVRFHDGTDLTADDVAFSLDRICEMGEAYHFEPWTVTMAGTEVVDRSTVRLRLSQPTGPMLTWLAFCGTGIVPRAAAKAGRNLDREPIGSGPFRLAEPWAGGDSPVRLERHDGSARGGAAFSPRLGGLEFVTIRDEGERVAALLNGRIDLDALLDPAAWQQVATTPGLVAHDTPDSRWHWLVVNCRQAPLGDPKVRRAIALAIDRQELIDEGFQGHGTPIEGGVIAPWSWAAAPAIEGFASRADAVAARAVLADAGVTPGTPLSITAADNLPIARRQAELIAAQLQAVGLDASVKVIPAADYAGSVSRDGDFQLATSYWGSPIWDPDDFVYMGFRSGARYDAGSCSSPALDALMDAGRGSLDRATRRRAYVDLQTLAVDQLPVIPTIQPGMLRGSTSTLRGWIPTPCGQLRTLRDAWLDD